MRLRLFLLALYCVGSVLADDSAAELNVRPKLCIVDQRTPHCDVKLALTWTSPKPGYYCVKREEDDAPLHCWVDENAGQVDDERKITKTQRYELHEDETTRASAEVEVLRMDSEDRRRRRRTRHVWDVL